MKKRFYFKDKKKNYIKKFRIYPTFLYYRLDKWLKSMSSKGWHIVHCGMFFFTFEKGEPEEKEYFTYFYARERKYDVRFQHPMLEKTYGMNRKKSKINDNQRKIHKVLEIDTDKIDVDNDVGYKKLVDDRNHFSTKRFLEIALVVSIFVLIDLIVCFCNKY